MKIEDPGPRKDPNKKTVRARDGATTGSNNSKRPFFKLELFSKAGSQYFAEHSEGKASIKSAFKMNSYICIFIGWRQFATNNKIPERRERTNPTTIY